MNVEHLKPYFHVVCMVSNPVRYESRYRLFNDFNERMNRDGVNLWVCEVQNGERAFNCTDATNPRHLQLRTEQELWIKECALNQLVERLPRDWKYIAFIDADVEFNNKNWVEETIQQLQVFNVVQMFQNCADLGPQGETLQVHTGFMFKYINRMSLGSRYENGHPGYAWAYTRFAFERLGRLIDRCILGSADYHMAASLIGRAQMTLDDYQSHGGLTQNYIEMILDWQSRAERHVKRRVSYVPGTILHYYHGSKAKRQYISRRDVLTKYKFDPWRDIYEDYQGLLCLDEDRIELRDAIQRYFRTRLEDDRTVTSMP